jgi:DNA-binding transcriptional MerR regulator
MRTLDDYRDWEGTIDDLAAASSEVLVLLGQGGVPAPNVRLIRDYAQRGILSPIDRRGKEGYYGYQHLKELVAARVLVNEGVPLAKIAEQFERDRDIVIVTLGLPAARPAAATPPNAARARWQKLRDEPPPVARGARSEGGSAAFMRRALEDAGQRMDLQRTLRRLGAPTTEPVPEQLTRLAITDWCALLIDTDRLRGLSLDEADDIGRAIAAALSDPRIRKGDKP